LISGADKLGVKNSVEDVEETRLHVRVAEGHCAQTSKRRTQDGCNLLLLVNDIHQDVHQIGIVEDLLSDLMRHI
jgi:hypothetical protein